ncbi:MAG: UDP-3-O-(3-hydroxymyristoyl)glucosamine N-acyltransferase [Micropepsaceae bacterium]
MADPRFFDSVGPFSIALIEQLTGSQLLSGSNQQLIADVAPLDRAGQSHLSYCDSPKFTSALRQTRASAVFVSRNLAQYVPEGVLTLECTRPSLAFAQTANALYPDAGLLWSMQHPPVMSIAPTVKVGANSVIAPGVFLGEGVEIGNDCAIGPGTVIGRGVQIGNGTRIGPHVTVSHAFIGDRCIIHPGSQLGQDGYGFVNGPTGHYKIPQLGRVIIQDSVEIGANVTIDRGALGDTIIGEGTKIDNLVQIGHNNIIGRHCIIVSQAGVSGSCEIGDFSVIGGQVGISDHLKVGKGTFIAGRSGVTHSLEGGKVYGGFPAKPIEQWRREVGAVSRLAKGSRAKNDRTGNE